MQQVFLAIWIPLSSGMGMTKFTSLKVCNHFRLLTPHNTIYLKEMSFGDSILSHLRPLIRRNTHGTLLATGAVYQGILMQFSVTQMDIRTSLKTICTGNSNLKHHQ